MLKKNKNYKKNFAAFRHLMDNYCNFDKCIEYTNTCKHVPQELHVGRLHLGYLL